MAMPEIKSFLWKVTVGLIILAFFICIEYESRMAIQLRIEEEVENNKYETQRIGKFMDKFTNEFIDFKHDIMPSAFKGKKRAR